MASPGLSSRGDLALGGPAASSAPISDRRKNPAASAARWVFGDLFAADRGTALNRSWGPSPWPDAVPSSASPSVVAGPGSEQPGKGPGRSADFALLIHSPLAVVSW